MREIKFRAWITNPKSLRGFMIPWKELQKSMGGNFVAVAERQEIASKAVLPGTSEYTMYEKIVGNIFDDKRLTLMQFTGLHDRNVPCKEVYEGDIIDANGRVKGNVYESPQVYEEGTDLRIEGMGTEAWRSAESVAMGRGCFYTKQ